MSTINETCNKIICPPGTTQGVNILSITKLPSSSINFPQARPTTPFPPIVQAFFNKENSILEVSAVIFIDANVILKPDENTENIINVYYQAIDPTPNFFITYNAELNASKKFKAYQVTFSINMNSKPSDIKTIVWDEDPETSRGTLTTVQP